MKNESQKKTITERLVKASGAKWLCLIIGIMVVFFYVRPIGLPVPISQTTKSFYDSKRNFDLSAQTLSFLQHFF